MFMDALDVDDVIAQLLVTEGFTSIEEVAYVPSEDLAGIEGFDEDVAGELKARATAWIEAEAARMNARRRELGAADELNDEKDGILKDFEVSTEDANAIIMAARAHWFAEEK